MDSQVSWRPRYSDLQFRNSLAAVLSEAQLKAFWCERVELLVAKYAILALLNFSSQAVEELCFPRVKCYALLILYCSLTISVVRSPFRAASRLIESLSLLKMAVVAKDSYLN